MRCLTIGISILIGILSISCDKGEVDYVVNLDYYYINKTNVPIRIKTFNKRQDGYHLLKDYKIKRNGTLHININSIGPQNLNVTEIRRPALYSDSTVFIYDQVKCESFRPSNIGINNINNYKSTEVKNNYFKLEYEITNEQFMNAEDCD